MPRFDVQVLVGESLLRTVDDESSLESVEYVPALNEAVTNLLYSGPVYEEHPVDPKPICSDCRREADNAENNGSPERTS